MNVACKRFAVSIFTGIVIGMDGKLTVMNFSASSMNNTGALRYSTACHSVQFKGVMAKRDCNILVQLPHTLETGERTLTVKKGIYKIATCKAMLRAMAPTRKGFFQIGSRSKLSFSESEFIALNISTVTRIERDIVVAR